MPFIVSGWKRAAGKCRLAFPGGNEAREDAVSCFRSDLAGVLPECSKDGSYAAMDFIFFIRLSFGLILSIMNA